MHIQAFSSFQCHVWIKKDYGSETLKLGPNRQFFGPCDIEIWWMTSKNRRAPLLCHLKVCASFCNHTEFKLELRPEMPKLGQNFIMIFVTLTFDHDFLYIHHLLLSMGITLKNCIMIRWKEHFEKGLMGRQLDGQTDRTIHIAAWSQLKKHRVCSEMVQHYTRLHEGHIS